MDRIKFITDSAGDIPLDMARQYNVDIAPLTVNIDGKIYRESYEIKPKEFYSLCRSCRELPTTSGVTPLDYLERYRKAISEGYNQIVVICINAKASMCYTSANQAKEMLQEEYPGEAAKVQIEIIDSKAYSIGYGQATLMAVAMHKAGAKLNEVLTALHDWFGRLEIYVAPLSFDFIRRSGRVSVTAAFIGQALGIRPVMSIIDGETKIVAKVRGDQKLPDAILKIVKERIMPGGSYGFVMGTTEEFVSKLYRSVKNALGWDSFGSFFAGSAIALNGGPDLVGMAFLGKDRRR